MATITSYVDDSIMANAEGNWVYYYSALKGIGEALPGTEKFAKAASSIGKNLLTAGEIGFATAATEFADETLITPHIGYFTLDDEACLEVDYKQALLNSGVAGLMAAGSYELEQVKFSVQEAKFAASEEARYEEYWKSVEEGTSGHPGMSEEEYAKWQLGDEKVAEQIALNSVDSDEWIEFKSKENYIKNSASAFGAMSDSEGIRYEAYWKYQEAIARGEFKNGTYLMDGIKAMGQ